MSIRNRANSSLNTLLSLAIALMLLLLPRGLIAQQIPKSVSELWGDYDPRAEPLDVRVIRKWDEGDIELSYITYTVGTFKGKESRVAAFVAYPKGRNDLPGLVHIHGGGQRAFLNEVRYYANRGYACLSVNWGGREMEAAKPGDENTDWGTVDPTQNNVRGYFNLKPGDLYLDPTESPRNNNWYLLTIACRRGLTVLEQMEEVNGERLGVYGHSMGGNLAVYVAGTDKRVKVAAPSVGGQGFRTYPPRFVPQQRIHQIVGDVELFRKTMAFESYAPHISVPIHWLSGTNDFHQLMDATYRTAELIPHENVRFAFSPHLNHRFAPEFAITRPLWIDQHLKGTYGLPPVPKTDLILAVNETPSFLVQPKNAGTISRVEVMYSIDPDPQARFWRTAVTKVMESKRPSWLATLPLLSTDQHLFVFANVYYSLPKRESLMRGPPVREFAISSVMHTAESKQLQRAGVLADDEKSNLIDDFRHGFQDWYALNELNPHHWQYWTRKINDQKWMGEDKEKLTLDVRVENANEIVFAINENFFRGYRGRSRLTYAVKKLTAGQWQTISLAPDDFKTLDGEERLEHWQHADEFGIRAFVDDGMGGHVGTKSWNGKQPEFRNLRWQR